MIFEHFLDKLYVIIYNFFKGRSRIKRKMNVIGKNKLKKGV